MMININLLEYNKSLQIENRESQNYIFDIIRKKYLVLTPEEIVRQLMIHFLIKEKGYPKNKIRVEMGLQVNTLSKRCDILIYDSNFDPLLLVECKSAKVKIDQKVFEQIATYNMTLKVPYLLVTNGPRNYCSFINHEENFFKFLKEIPEYNLIC
jgi:hypothetical protein